MQDDQSVVVSSRGTLHQPSNVTIINFNQWALKNVHNIPDVARDGLQYSVILMSAVFFEASMYSLLKRLSDGIRGIELENQLYERIATKFADDCRRATNLESYKEIFATLSSNQFSELLCPEELEGLANLFQLRHHLVHGRPNVLDVQWDGMGSILSNNLTSLKNIETYFQKVGLFSKLPTHQRGFSEYFGFEIAKWSWNTVTQAILKIAESRKGESRVYFNYLNSIDGFKFETFPTK